MDKIVYMGIDLASDNDYTSYYLYDPIDKKHYKVTKEEYEYLIMTCDPTIPHVDKFQR